MKIDKNSVLSFSLKQLIKGSSWINKNVNQKDETKKIGNSIIEQQRGKMNLKFFSFPQKKKFQVSQFATKSCNESNS